MTQGREGKGGAGSGIEGLGGPLSPSLTLLNQLEHKRAAGHRNGILKNWNISKFRKTSAEYPPAPSPPTAARLVLTLQRTSRVLLGCAEMC